MVLVYNSNLVSKYCNDIRFTACISRRTSLCVFFSVVPRPKSPHRVQKTFFAIFARLFFVVTSKWLPGLLFPSEKVICVRVNLTSFVYEMRSGKLLIRICNTSDLRALSPGILLIKFCEK